MTNDGEALERLRDKLNKTQTQRHAHEVRPVAYADRRAMMAPPPKNTQLNLKVTAAFKSRVTAAAVVEKCSVTALIERAVREYLERAKK